MMGYTVVVLRWRQVKYAGGVTCQSGPSQDRFAGIIELVRCSFGRSSKDKVTSWTRQLYSVGVYYLIGVLVAELS